MTRKSVRHDLTQGVVTPPLIYALARQPHLRGAARTVFDRPGELPSLLRAVATAGGLHDSWRLAGRYYQKALQQLEQIADPDRRGRLRGFLDMAVGERAVRLRTGAQAVSERR